MGKIHTDKAFLLRVTPNPYAGEGRELRREAAVLVAGGDVENRREART